MWHTGYKASARDAAHLAAVVQRDAVVLCEHLLAPLGVSKELSQVGNLTSLGSMCLQKSPAVGLRHQAGGVRHSVRCAVCHEG
jgi:hypothetical protein